MPTAPHNIRRATEADVPELLAMIRELADYEKELSSVQATEESLLATLTFPSDPSKGYAKAILIFPATAPKETALPRGTHIPVPPPEAAAVEPAPAGFALYFHNYSTWRAAPGIYLEDLFVRPQHRGSGFGRALIGALARQVLDVNGGRLEWSVLKWNTPSIDFYQSSKVGATRMEDWVGMRVDSDEALRRLADGDA